MWCCGGVKTPKVVIFVSSIEVVMEVEVGESLTLDTVSWIW